MRVKMIAKLTGVVVWLFSINLLQAIEVDPGDYTALPKGTNIALMYVGYGADAGTSGVDYDANINLARYVHYNKLLGMTVDPQFIIPFGHVSLDVGTASVIDTTSVGDPILAMTLWLHETETTQFGFTPFISVPIGDYDGDRGLDNFGGNRFATTLQLGVWHKPTDKLLLEMIGDVTVFSDNTSFGPNDATREQDESYQLQLTATYGVTDKLRLGVKGSYISNGETRIDNIGQNDESEVWRGYLYGQYFIRPNVQIQVKYYEDLKSDAFVVDNLREFQIRLLYAF